MKYLEELEHGSTFVYNDLVYLLTIDFKKDHKLVYSLKDGSSRWLKDDTIVELSPIYILDPSNNIIPIKETEKHAEF
jgi:hypothetical protein